MRKYLLFLFTILSPIIASAQVMSLRDCINFALSHRVELSKQNIQVDYQSKLYRYSKFELLPTVSADLVHQLSSGRSLNIDTYNWENSSKQQGSLALNAELILFDGLQMIRKIKQSKLTLARNQTYLAKQQNDIRLEVIKAYSELQTIIGNIRILNEIVANTDQRIMNVSIAVKAGKTSLIDLLELQAQKEKQQKDLLDALKNKLASNLSLQKAINNSLAIETFDDVQSDTTSLVLNVKPDSIFQLAVSSLPELQLAKLDSVYWQTAVAKAKGLYSPTLKLNSTLASQYLVNATNPVDAQSKYGFSSQLANNRYWQTSVTLSIPIYDRHLYRVQVAESVKSYNQSLSDKGQLTRDIRIEIEQLCAEINHKQQIVSNLKRQVDLYTTIYRMRQKQYDAGALSITDLMLAEANYTQSLLNYNNASHVISFAFELLKIYTNPS